MGKKKTDTSGMINRGAQQDQSAYTNFFNQIMSQVPGIQQQHQADRNRLVGGYENYLSSIPGRFGEARAGYSNMAGGGINPAAQARMRGGGVYDEFARTGGMTPEMTGNIRARTASMTPSFFSGLKDNMARMNAVQGGYSPGYSGQAAKLSREAARDATGAVRDTEINLADMTRSGRMWGAEGMTSSEGSLQELLSRNIFGGLAGLTDIGSRESGMELSGLGGLQDVFGMRDPSLDWLNLGLDTLGGRTSSGLGWTGQSGAEDQRRWDRKRQIANTIFEGAKAIPAGG